MVVFDFHPSPPSTCCLGKQAALLLTFNCLGSSYAVYYISGKNSEEAARGYQQPPSGDNKIAGTRFVVHQPLAANDSVMGLRKALQWKSRLYEFFPFHINLLPWMTVASINPVNSVHIRKKKFKCSCRCYILLSVQCWCWTSAITPTVVPWLILMYWSIFSLFCVCLFHCLLASLLVSLPVLLVCLFSCLLV